MFHVCAEIPLIHLSINFIPLQPYPNLSPRHGDFMGKLSPWLTWSAVAMARLEMALWIPVNEGGWGRGREGEYIKVPFAVCLLDVFWAKFCSVIGLQSIGGHPVALFCCRTPHSVGHWCVCWTNRAPTTRPLWAVWADGSLTHSLTEKRHRCGTKGRRRQSGRGRLQHAQTEIILHYTDIRLREKNLHDNAESFLFGYCHCIFFTACDPKSLPTIR